MKLSKKTNVLTFFILFLWVACSSLNINEGASIITASSAPTTTTVPRELTSKSTAIHLPEIIPSEVEIHFWHPWSGEMANLINELADEFNQTNEWGIFVKISAFADDRILAQRVADVIEQGDTLPELIAAPDFILAAMVDHGVELLDLDNYLISPGTENSQDQLERYYTIFLDAGIYKGRRIGFPAYASGNFLIYNQSWAQTLGFKLPPDSPELFREQMCAASKANQYGNIKENIGTGGWIYSNEPLDFLSWMIAFGENEGVDSLSPSYLLIDREHEGSYFLFDMFMPINNCAWIGRQKLPYQYFTHRQSLAYCGKLEDILIQEQVNQSNGSEDKWTVIPYPSVEGNKPIVIISTDFYSITTADKGKAIAAWEFVQWMTKIENQEQVVETTGSFPLSMDVLYLLEDFRALHPAWSEGLSYLPFVERIPFASDWLVARDILSDVSWQLVQYTTMREDIPEIWEDANQLYLEVKNIEDAEK